MVVAGNTPLMSFKNLVWPTPVLGQFSETFSSPSGTARVFTALWHPRVQNDQKFKVIQSNSKLNRGEEGVSQMSQYPNFGFQSSTRPGGPEI
jgi:hypothetical protein